MLDSCAKVESRSNSSSSEVTRYCDFFHDELLYVFIRPVHAARHVRTVSEYHEDGSIQPDHGNYLLTVRMAVFITRSKYIGCMCSNGKVMRSNLARSLARNLLQVVG